VADHHNCLWQRVPDRRCWKPESTPGKVCPGERLDQQRDGRWSKVRLQTRSVIRWCG